MHASRGFGTLELLIAMAFAIMVISAALLVSFGDQGAALGSQMNAGALALAGGQLAAARALSREDFNLVNATTSTEGLYTVAVSVTLLPDSLTKRVTSTASWASDRTEPFSVSLTTLVTNLDNVSAPDTCNSSLSGDWTQPKVLNPSHAIDISPDIPTGIAVVHGLAYITGSRSGSNPDFFVVNVADSSWPVFANPSTPGINTGPGLAAVAVAGDYAYVANRSVAGQLQVINITNPSNPILATSTRVTGAGGVGNAIFYYNHMVYLGLTASGAGPQFAIFDVASSTKPVAKGTYTLGHTVNSLVVKGPYAYIATAAPEELNIFDISDPMSPQLVGGSGILPDTTANGKSVYVVGDTLYLGRTVGLSPGTKQFYIFDTTDPTTDPLPVLGSPTDVNDSINSLLVRSDLAFFTTRNEFQVWSLSNVHALTKIGSLPLASTTPALDCENNTLYVGVAGPSGNGTDALKIIGPGP